jgi:iron-sulfur cluster assembly protein
MQEIIKLTPAAQQQAKALLSKEVSKEALRIAVIGGGCSGLQYKLGWDNSKENDMVFEYENGLKVLIDDKSALFLLDSILEYHNDIDRSGFEVINPNAKNSCGCGKSFN